MNANVVRLGLADWACFPPLYQRLNSNYFTTVASSSTFNCCYAVAAATAVWFLVAGFSLLVAG